jgi:transcriptional regulator with XRE-family HTH domain
MVDFFERLREARIETGLSQTDFAAKAGVTKKTQSLYERGERSPSAEYLSAISDLVDVTYLLTGNRSVPVQLAPDESALLENYRHLCDEQREAVFRVSEVMSAGTKQEKNFSQG